MRDKDLILRAGSVGNLTQTFTGSWVNLQGLPSDGIDLYVLVPAASAGDTLDIVVQDSANGSDTIDTIHMFKQITNATVVPCIIHAPLSGYRQYIRLIMAVAVVGDPANFGAVEAWLAAGPRKIAGE